MKWRTLFAHLGVRRKKNLAHRLARSSADARKKAERSPGSIHSFALIVSQDAYPAGAQRLLLNLLGEWRQRDPFPVKVICGQGGALRPEFEALYPTLVLSDFQTLEARDDALVAFCDGLPRVIYSSTIVNGPLLENLRALGAPVVTHCHELQAAIERWAVGSIMTDTLFNSDIVLSGCDAVARNLRVRHQVPNERSAVVWDFINLWRADRIPSAAELNSLRSELSIAAEDIVVYGCGTTDWRKGPDLFVQIAVRACRADARLRFIWIGGEASPPQFQEAIAAEGLIDRIRFIGDRPLSRRYYYIGHLFALTSREDPCPLAALEAADAKLPVVCFDGAGDIPVTLGAECGAVIDFQNADAFASSLVTLANDERRRAACGQHGFDRVATAHSTQSAAVAIEKSFADVERMPRKSLGHTLRSPLVSVIVPNYNHEKFLQQRLKSIARQSFGDFEIIALDDASTDGSACILESFVAKHRRARLISNRSNSGSTFKQWRKALAEAQGRYIWIAESDDYADRSFLTRTVSLLQSDSSLVIAHTQSHMVDVDGRPLGRPDGWLDDLAPGRWNVDFVADGVEEIRGFLGHKNTIPNASAVVFRNFPGIEFLVDDTMRLCADWLFWIRMLARGRYGYIAADLNFWRQNSSNARTRPPGVLEWEEGRRVLDEACAILGLDAAQRLETIQRFRRRCSEWSDGAIDN